MKEKQNRKFDTVKLGNVRVEKKKNSSIIFIIYLFIALLLALFIYLTLFQINKAEKLRLDSRNPRLIAKEKNIILGTIYGADKSVLAITENEEGKLIRKYPQGKEFAHVVGYSSNSRFGLEDSLYNELLNTSKDNESFLEKLKNADKDIDNVGNSVVTTIVPKLQKLCFDKMGNRKGAVVLMEPSTGKILAMVSKPSFDPNKLKSDWEEIVNNNTDAPLLNRATQGLYPPGSTFKVITALEYMREHADYDNFTYNCPGIIDKYNQTIACAYKKAHGKVGFDMALAKSCNGAFVEMGINIDVDKYKQLAESFGFNNELPIDDFKYSQSKFVLNKDSSYAEIIHTAFGQGNTLVTPLQNCLIASTIANSGIMMKVQFVDYVEDSSHKIVKKIVPMQYKTVLRPLENQIISDMMKDVVKKGTGQILSDFSYSVACKTGTAQYNNSNNSHNILIGFAPADEPKIAFSIVLEGYEGQPQKDTQALSMAKDILYTYLGE